MHWLNSKYINLMVMRGGDVVQKCTSSPPSNDMSRRKTCNGIYVGKYIILYVVKYMNLYMGRYVDPCICHTVGENHMNL